MSLGSCRHQQDVQQASASGRWSAALTAHASECPTCRDVRLISGVFAAAPAEARSSRTADPVLLWARAREERRLRAEAKVSLVTTTTQITIGTVVSTAVLLVAPTLVAPMSKWANLVQEAASSAVLTNAVLGLGFAGLGGVLLTVVVLSRRTSQDA